MSESLLPVDEIFIDYPNEWYEGMEMSSAHDADSIKQFDLAHSYVLFCYPRDFTPVCKAELDTLSFDKPDFPIEVIAGSTDSPEVHNAFFSDTKTFAGNVNFPVVTISERNLTDKGKALILNEYGYCRRVAIIIVNGAVRAVFETDNNVERDISVLLKLTKSVLKKE